MKLPRLSSSKPTKTGQAALGVGVALLLCSAWFGWSAWQQYQGMDGERGIQAAHQAMVVTAKKEVSGALGNFEKQLASDTVRAAAAAGDWDGASKALTALMPGASEVRVVSSDLSGAYDDPKISYARLAAMEAAILDGKAYAGAAPHGMGVHLAMAAPIIVDGHTAGVAYTQTPFKSLVGAGSSANISEDGYLALQMGLGQVFKQGEESLATSPNAKRDDIPRSGLSVVSVSPDVAKGPFGLGLMGSLIGAGLLLAMGVGAFIAPTILRKRVIDKRIAQGQSIDTGGDDFVVPDVIAPRKRIEPVDAVVPENATTELAEVLFEGGLAVGAIGAQVDAERALKLGRLIGQWLHGKGMSEVAIGRDARNSSGILLEGLALGMVEMGRRVHDLGMVATPLLAFAGRHLGDIPSIAVVGDTHSEHNTGLIVLVDGKPLLGAQLNELTQGGKPYKGELGQREAVNVDEAYLNKLTENIDLPRRATVAVSGVHQSQLSKVLEQCGVEVSPEGAEFGLGLTDNGAAIYLTNSQGDVLAPENVLSLLLMNMLERSPGLEFVCDPITAETLGDAVMKRGGGMNVVEGGVLNIHAAMVERGSTIGGDSEGHPLLAERSFNSPDGFLAAVRLIEILSYIDHADSILV